MYRLSRKWPRLIAYYVSLLLALAGCGGDKHVETKPSNCLSDSMLRSIAFDTIRLRPLLEELKLTGKVTFDEDKVVRVFSPVGGSVEKLTVSLGDPVEKGQILAQIKSSDMAGFASQYRAAVANLNIAKKAMEVSQEFFKTGLASEKDYLTSIENYKIALAEVTRMKRVVSLYGDSTHGMYYLRAPISGFIVEKNVSEGTMLREDNGDNTFTISDLKQVWVMANLFEQDLKRVKIGDSVNVVTLAYDKPYQGIVKKISKTIDSDTKVNRVRIVIQNPDFRLQPEMFANVYVRNANTSKLLPSISANASVFDENTYFIVTYKNPCDMKVVKIVPHSTVGNTLYLDESAQPGTVVLSRYQLLVYDKLNNQH